MTERVLILDFGFQCTPIRGKQCANYELSPLGVHWPEVDEDLSIGGMLVGRRAPGAKQPEPSVTMLRQAFRSNSQPGLRRR